MHHKKSFLTIIAIIILCFVGSAGLVFKIQWQNSPLQEEKVVLVTDNQDNDVDIYAEQRKAFELGEHTEGSRFWRSIDQNGYKEGTLFGHEITQTNFDYIDRFRKDSARMAFVPNEYEVVMVDSFNINSNVDTDSAELFVTYKQDILCEGGSTGPGCIEDNYYIRIIRPIQDGWELIFDYKIVDTNYAVGYRHFRNEYYLGKGYALDGLILWGGKARSPEMPENDLFIVFDEQKDRFVNILGSNSYGQLNQELLTQDELDNGCALQYDITRLDTSYYSGGRSYYYGMTYPNGLVWLANVTCPSDKYSYKTVRNDVKTFYTIKDYALVPYSDIHIFADNLYRGSTQISDTPIDEILFKDFEDKVSVIGQSMAEFAYAANIVHQYNYDGKTGLVVGYYGDCWPCSWNIPREITLDSNDTIVGVDDLDLHKGFFATFHTVSMNDGKELLYAFNSPEEGVGIEVRSYNFITGQDKSFKKFYDDNDIFECNGSDDEGIECMVDGQDKVKAYMDTLR